MVNKKEFDELVANTTAYLTSLIKQVKALEEKVEKLEKKLENPPKNGRKTGTSA